MTGILHLVSSYSRAARRGKEGWGRFQIEDFRLKTFGCAAV
jgi:hypothetical protein